MLVIPSYGLWVKVLGDVIEEVVFYVFGKNDSIYSLSSPPRGKILAAIAVYVNRCLTFRLFLKRNLTIVKKSF